MEHFKCFKCDKCKKSFWRTGDKYFVCPICKERDCVKRVQKNRVTSQTKKKVDVKSLDVLQNWGDITLVEDIISVVGSAINKEDPNDVDVAMKFSGLKVVEDAIKEVVEKRHLRAHLIAGESHGEYVPKYDLILKEKVIEKKTTLKLPQYKYTRPSQFTEKMEDTDRFVVEPLIPDAKRVMIIRKDGVVKIHSTAHKLIKNESFIKRIQMIETPIDFIYDGHILKNGTIVLQDIIEKDNCNLRDDPLLSRKTFLIKSRISREANIAFIKFYYAKSKEDMANKIYEWKNKGMNIVLKPAFSKYLENSGWMKMEFKPAMRVDLGCGPRKAIGYYGIDIVKNEQVDKVYDLSKGIPLDDNSCKVVRANHFIEHLEDSQSIMEEIYRVLKNGGRAIITVPEASTWGAKSHPEHKSFFDEFSMENYCEPYLIKKYQTHCYFELLHFRKRVFYTNDIKRVHLTWIIKAIKD